MFKLTPTQRARAALNYFKDLPNEFESLKGVLLLDYALSQGAKKAGMNHTQEAEESDLRLDYMLIAIRMDELRWKRSDEVRAARTSAQQLADQFAYEHPGFPRADWRHDVDVNITDKGYWDWLVVQLEKEAL